MALAPDWLQFLSNINPLTHAVDAARALFNADWGNPDIAIGVTISDDLRRLRGLGRVASVHPGGRLGAAVARRVGVGGRTGPPGSAERLAGLARLVRPQPNADQVSSTETRDSHIRSPPSSGCQPLSRVRSVWIFERALRVGDPDDPAVGAIARGQGSTMAASSRRRPDEDLDPVEAGRRGRR